MRALQISSSCSSNRYKDCLSRQTRIGCSPARNKGEGEVPRWVIDDSTLIEKVADDRQALLPGEAEGMNPELMSLRFRQLALSQEEEAL